MTIVSQTQISVAIKRDNSIRLVGRKFAIDVDRLVPTAGGRQLPGLLQPRRRGTGDDFDVRRRQLDLRRLHHEAKRNLLGGSDTGAEQQANDRRAECRPKAFADGRESAHEFPATETEEAYLAPRNYRVRAHGSLASELWLRVRDQALPPE